jgi:hypothetical protein
MTQIWQRCLGVVAVVCLLAVPALAVAEDAVNVTGNWEVSWQGRQGMRIINIAFQQDGEKLTGTYVASTGQEVPVTGTIEGAKITFSVTMPTQQGEFTINFKGTVEGDAMSGTLTVGDAERPWTGKKLS